MFPAEYGASYDTDMQLLVWEFLSKLEKILPVPDLGQVPQSNTALGHLQLGSSHLLLLYCENPAVLTMMATFRLVKL